MSACSSVSFDRRVVVATERDADLALGVLVERDRARTVVAPGVGAEGEDALDGDRDGVVLGTLELVDALLQEQVRDQELLLQHPTAVAASFCGLTIV